MNRKEKILQKLQTECKLTDMMQVQVYIMNRKEQIIQNHIDNVFPIKEPGEKGGDAHKWLTKLTPHIRNHDGKIRANSRKELEDKILAYYLNIEDEKKTTIQSIFTKAVDVNTKTGTRQNQRFNKYYSSIAQLPISKLNEQIIRNLLDEIVETRLSKKSFDGAVTVLNKIYDYCKFEHIEVCDIRRIICEYKLVKLNGKHVFIDTKKNPKNMVFSKQEANTIVQYAIENPSYKSLAIALLIFTGLRVGELLGLEIVDVDLTNNLLWIHQTEETSKSKGSKEYKILDYVKENKHRQVSLSPDARMIIDMLFELRENDDIDNPFLFVNKKSSDKKMHLRALDSYLRKTIHKTVLGYGSEREPRSPHDCRRTYASLEYLNGSKIEAICAQLGHTDISQTQKYIFDVVDIQERKSSLKGTGIVVDALGRNNFPKEKAQ